MAHSGWVQGMVVGVGELVAYLAGEGRGGEALAGVHHKQRGLCIRGITNQSLGVDREQGHWSSREESSKCPSLRNVEDILPASVPSKSARTIPDSSFPTPSTPGSSPNLTNP